MKTMKIWRIAFAMFAAFSLASCSSDDDDDNISEAQIQQTLFEMKNAYHGQIQFGLKEQPNDRAKLDGSTALSAQGLMLDIPLAPIADQVADETLAEKIRAVGTATVYSEYKFETIADGTAHFLLTPRMIPDVKTTAVTRTSPVTYPGLALFFSDNYGGDFQTQDSWIGFNLCVELVLIDNEPLEGFKPVIYRYEGSSNAYTEQTESETELEKERRQQTDYELQGKWFLDEQEVLAQSIIGESKTNYDRSVSGYVYDFYNGHFIISYFEKATGKNKLLDNGTYAIRYNESTNDTVLRLYKYATEDESPQLVHQFTIYDLGSSTLEFRKHKTNSEEIYRMSRYTSE